MIYLQHLIKRISGIANAALSQLSYIPELNNHRSNSQFLANEKPANCAVLCEQRIEKRAQYAPDHLQRFDMNKNGRKRHR